MDIQNFCRTCLECKPKFSIFADEVLQKLKICGGIEVEESENKIFPSMICHKCFNDLEMAFEFRTLCQKSEKKLKDDLKAMDFEIEDGYIENLKIEFLHPKEEQNEIPKLETEFTSEIEDGWWIDEADTEIDDVDVGVEDLEDVIEEICPESLLELKNYRCDEDTDLNIINIESSTDNESNNLNTDIKPIVKVKQKYTKRIKTKSDGKVIYACAFCDSSYLTKISLETHMKLHSLQLKYVCEICGDSYSGKIQLDQHMCSAHTGERKFKCDYCEKAFFSKAYQHSHQRRSHSKRYKCQQCEKSFGRPDALQQHTRVHTGEKPVICEKCGKSFKEIHHLKNHYKSMHPI